MSSEPLASRRRWLPRLLLAGAALVILLGFLALGTWQLQRREWKLALIERVELRVRAPPMSLVEAFPAPAAALGAGAGGASAPARQDWGAIDRQDLEYRHVQVAGRLLPGLSTWVEASTKLGPGYWLITPLKLDDGRVILLNRGFVVNRAQPVASDEIVHPSGLLRLSEPGGRLLRPNEPTANRWYSRDVQAIAQARGLARVAPFFIDVDAQAAAATGGPGRQDAGAAEPVGGLTVISFPNNHLVYALTWYALALMMAAAVWLLMRGGGD